VARRRKKGRHGKKKIPLAIVVPALYPVIPAVKSAMAGNFARAGLDLRWDYLGVNDQGQFSPTKLVQNMTPIVVGILVHKYVGPYINKRLPKSIPVGL